MNVAIAVIDNTRNNLLFVSEYEIKNRMYHRHIKYINHMVLSIGSKGFVSVIVLNTLKGSVNNVP